MRNVLLAATALALVAVGAATTARADDGPPNWAYGFATPLPNPPPPRAQPNPPAQLDSTKQLTLPGSKLSFSRAQIANRFGPADWFPEDHPSMPDVVAHGKESAQPQVFACGLCHYPNGKGRPENANITGLSYEYFVQQLMDFRAGARNTSDPRKANTAVMASFTKSLSDDDIKTVAKYFTAIPATPWIKVVEQATVPKTKPAGGIFLPLEGAEAGTEPIGARIIETPVNPERPSCCAIRARASSPMCRRAASRRARCWSRRAPARSRPARPATASTCTASDRCRRSPAVRRATWRASSTTCSTATAPAPGRR